VVVLVEAVEPVTAFALVLVIGSENYFIILYKFFAPKVQHC
jgi:hypothetical protein